MKKIIVSILFLLVANNLSAQPRRGFGFTAGAWGSGFHFSSDWEVSPTLFSGLEIRFIDIKNDGEMPAMNYYTGQYINVGDDALIMFPAYAKISYLPFEGMIANNFSPFIEFKLGANFAIDGKGSARKFRDRWKNPSTYISYGGQTVFGVYFPQPNGTAVSASIGYESLPLSQKIDGRNNYDGVTLYITYIFGKRL